MSNRPNRSIVVLIKNVPFNYVYAERRLEVYYYGTVSMDVMPRNPFFVGGSNTVPMREKGISRNVTIDENHNSTRLYTNKSKTFFFSQTFLKRVNNVVIIIF